jgi:hypothetical protein
MYRFRFVSSCAVALALSACAGSSSVPPTSPSGPTLTAAGPPSESTATPKPDCPFPPPGLVALEDNYGRYCLHYPDGYGFVVPFDGEVCLVPGEPPYLACHSAALFINVEPGNDRTLDQVADALLGNAPSDTNRSASAFAGEEALVLEPYYDQATSRIVLILHAGQLYTLKFIGPWGEEDNPDLEAAKRFYDQVMGSFSFLAE